MRNINTIVIAVMTAALLLSLGMAPARAASVSGTDKVSAQERKSQRSAVKRNAAAKALKTQLDKDKKAKEAQQGAQPGK